MRRLALLPLLLALPFAPASAHASDTTCLTYAGPPHFTLAGDGIHAWGSFGCTTPSTGISVGLCLEELGFDNQWHSLNCWSNYAPPQRYHLSIEVVYPTIVYSTTLRSTVTANDDAGDVGSAESPPTPWFNCACSVG